MLAALNHPNIGAIYGVEDVDGIPGLVLELVDGTTLAERLAKGPLPVRDALAIAAQIALALETAHEKGIVHRDLKPANVVLTTDGQVKVLDFGLAKGAVGDASGPDLSQSPTKNGAILGTGAHMSPEQARGRPVDKRADVWAFGCVLFEMLTDRLAFPGDTLSDTIASILHGEPDWRALPEKTPAGLQRLLRRCLEKDPTRRLRDIGDARLDVDEALTAPSQIAQSPSPVRRWPARVAWALAASGITAAIGMAVPYFRGTAERDAQPVRFTLAPPTNTVLPSTAVFAVSPDGRRLVFEAMRAGTSLLWVRSFDALEAQSLPGTEGAGAVIWSPDSRTVAFVADNKLKAIELGSGSTRNLCDVEFFVGASWSPDSSTLVFATRRGGVFAVAANGGMATPLANPDASAQAPMILPDGRHFIYRSSPENVAWLAVLDSKEPPVRLFDADSQIEYVDPGYLVFVRRGALMARRFNAQRASLAGEAVPIADAAPLRGGYTAVFATSRNGVLVYRRDRQNVPTQLTWADRSGNHLSAVGSPGRYRNPELSPDGLSVVMEVLDPQSGSIDIGRLDLGRGVTTRLTSDPEDDVLPTWSPDGAWITFAAKRGGDVPQLYRMRANGTGSEERVSRSKTAMFPQGWAPDARTFVFQSRPAFKLGLLSFSEGSIPRLFDDSLKSSIQGFGQVSPDGHWLTYAASERGTAWDVFVQSFPTPGRGKWQVSRDRGASPRWSRDGREIFYYGIDGRLMAVSVVNRGSGLEFGTAAPLFKASLLGGPAPIIPLRQQYDVASDGRFLLNLPVEPASDQSFSVAVNWTAGLTRSR
jgi:Tol biopolymer transport system component